MCEIFAGDSITGFSLLNAVLPDAETKILGSNSGFTLGNSDNAQAVHRIVDKLLRNGSDSPIRQQVIPIKVLGPHRGARGELAGRIRLALRKAKRITIVPCDGFGAPAWFRLESWNMDIVTEDYKAKYAGEQQYTITLNVDAWAKAEEKYTAEASNALPTITVWDAAVSGDAGWTVQNGTLDPASSTSWVGVLSDVSSGTQDGLRNATLAWDPSIDGGYTLVAIEAKINPASGLDVGGGGTIYPGLYVQGYHAGEWVNAATALVSRVDLGSGWYRETLHVLYGLPEMDGFGVVATGGDPADQDVKIRKVTMAATNTFSSGAAVMFLNIPGSEPTEVDLEIDRADPGVLVYTAPVFADYPDYSPLTGPGPEGVYHLVIDRSGGTASKLNVTVNGVLHRTIDLNALPYADTGFICVASDIYHSPTSPATVSVTGADGSLSVHKTMWLWVEDVLTGQAGDYTMTGVVAGTPSLKINARTPERPVPSYTINGIQDDELIRAAGDHLIEPGWQRVLVAWHGSSSPAGADFKASLYPAFHTDVPPSTRWFVS